MNVIDVEPSTTTHLSPTPRGTMMAKSSSPGSLGAELVISMTDSLEKTSPVMRVTTTPGDDTSSLSLCFGVASTSSLPALQTSGTDSSASAYSTQAALSFYDLSPEFSDNAGSDDGWNVGGPVIGGILLHLTTIGVSGSLCAHGVLQACPVFKWSSATIGSYMEFYKKIMNTHARVPVTMGEIFNNAGTL